MCARVSKARRKVNALIQGFTAVTSPLGRPTKGRRWPGGGGQQRRIIGRQRFRDGLNLQEKEVLGAV